MALDITSELLNTDSLVIKEFINLIKDNEIYNEIIKDVKEQFFVDDRVHGISHNERTTMIVGYLGIKEGLNDDELKILLYAALYHDIGRKEFKKGTRGIGSMHGLKSSEIIEKNSDILVPDLSKEDIEKVKALCIAHSINDSEIAKTLESYGINMDSALFKLIQILKDADALDRVRLPHGNLDKNYLRTNFARELAEKNVSRYLYNQYRQYEKSDKQDNNGLITDGKYYYLLRSLNKTDIENLEKGNGIFPRNNDEGIYIARDVLEHACAFTNKSGSFISMSADPNVVLTYDRTNLHKFILIKLNKEDIEQKDRIFSSGDYLLKEMEAQVNKYLQNADDKIKEILGKIENASDLEQVKSIIKNLDKKISTSLIDNKLQYLSETEELKQAKVIAKCKVLNYYGIMKNVEESFPRMGTIEKYTSVMRASYHNAEWLTAKQINRNKIVEVPKFIVDALALVKQAEFNGKSMKALRQVEKEIIRVATFEKRTDEDIDMIDYTTRDTLKNDLTIDDAFKMTDGSISYRDLNMQLIAIRSLAEATLNKRKIINVLRKRIKNIDLNELFKDSYCINPDMSIRQNNRGHQIGKNINFIISDYGYDFDSSISKRLLFDVQNLSNEDLNDIVVNGNKSEKVLELISNVRNDYERINALQHKSDELNYIAEAIVEGYNWKKYNSILNSDEKEKLLSSILTGVFNPEGLKTLYNAVSKTTWTNNWFSQEEVFGIIMNIAIERKFCGINYSDIVKMDMRSIQDLLLKNKNEIQTIVSPIVIDIRLNKGKAWKKLKENLIASGIKKEFIESKNARNIYTAKYIVDNYKFDRKLKDFEKAAIVRSILDISNFKKDSNNYYLATLINNFKKIGFDTQEALGIIINLAINRTIIQEPGYNYKYLIANESNCCETIKQYKDKINPKVTEETIKKSIIDNEDIYVSDVDEEELWKSLEVYGLDKKFLQSKGSLNVNMAKYIVDKYDFGRALQNHEKAAIIKSILRSSKLEGKYENGRLPLLMKNLSLIGINGQDLYGMIINLAVNKKVIEENGYSYRFLITNENDCCKTIAKYKDKIQTEVTEKTINKAVKTTDEKYVAKQSNEDIIKSLLELGISEEFLRPKKESNIFMAKYILDNYKFPRVLDKNEKAKIIESILKDKKLNKGFYREISKVMRNLEIVGFKEQEALGIIISLSLIGNVIKKPGYGYSSAVNKGSKSPKAFIENKDEVLKSIEDTMSKINDGSIFKDKSKEVKRPRKVVADNGITEEDIKENLKEFSNNISDIEFLLSKGIKNVDTAIQVINKHDFGRALETKEKYALLQAILNNNGLIEKSSRLPKSVKYMEELGFDFQEISGMIINLAVNGSVTKKDGYGYDCFLAAPNKFSTYAKDNKDAINTNVDELVIRKAVVNNNDLYKINISHEEIKNLSLTRGVREDFAEMIKPEILHMAMYIVDNYSFCRDLKEYEKSALMNIILNKRKFQRRDGYSLVALVKRLELLGLDFQEISGAIINMAVNKTCINRSGYAYDALLSNAKNSTETIAKYKDEIKSVVEESTIEKAVEMIQKEFSCQDIVKATVDVTIEGSGGSELCDDVKKHYQGLIKKDPEKNGSDINVGN